jgi:hypothetical protein
MLRYAARTGTVNGRLAREIVAPGMFVALILTSNFALADLPNVKFFDLLVFVAGYTLGFRRGATVAVAAMLTYEIANPWGPAGMALLLTKVGAEVVYAMAGALAQRVASPDRVVLGPSRLSLLLVVAAVGSTLAYDVATNLYTGWFWGTLAGGTEYARWIGVALVGPGAVLFMALHIGSNAVLFPVFGPLLMKGADRVKRSIGWDAR